MTGWSDPSSLCSTPICSFEGAQGCGHGKCIFPNVCACEVGWDGPTCDVCIPLGGCLHGTCQKPLECNCEHGWTGPLCSKAKCDGCVHGCCHEPYKCICDFGWTGQYCNDCVPLTNCKFGKCINQPFECQCDEGYQGIGCSKPICRDGCHSHFGYCHHPGECFCKEGWTGVNCDECVPSSGCSGKCVHNIPGTCSDISIQSSEWNQWESWSPCGATCGESIQKRIRSCLSPDGNCGGSSEESVKCILMYCPLNGNWSPWSRWTSCNLSCGTGLKTRNRLCASPSPKYGGVSCIGESDQSISCFLRSCPIDGRWSTWLSWEPCSVTCGKGQQKRRRSCDSPAASFEGMECFGSSVGHTSCSPGECPVDGDWGDWTSWSTCSKTCGQGLKSRMRNCNPPIFGGALCPGGLLEDTEVLPCIESLECSIDGKWSTWKSWSECSSSCGEGHKLRERECSSPKPSFGGAFCFGPGWEKSSCLLVLCPIDGSWGPWQSWSSCSASCETGTQMRARNCAEPQNGGSPCNLSWATENRTCGVPFCPTDGSWSDWSNWSTCSVSCGTGSWSRNRKCIEPIHGGRPCVGGSEQNSVCSLAECVPDPEWSTWFSWSTCSVSCGGGRRNRNRDCKNNQTSSCPGSSSESDNCSQNPCPIIGNWGPWEPWNDCSQSCNGGTRSRRRMCMGENCVGLNWEENICNNQLCSIDGNWGNWGNWASCSASCGSGNRRRERICDSPVPSNGGHPCLGISNQQEICDSYVPCPIDGGLTSWTIWSECTAKCLGDRGDTVRRRFCTNPRPQFGGRNCTGETRDLKHCTGEVPKQTVDPSQICFYINRK